MNNEACSKDSPECCGGKGENCADKGVAAAAQPPSTNELILTLQNTVIGLQSQVAKLGEVLNNVSAYAQKIDQAAGVRIMTLEKHCGIEQKQSDAPAPIESVEAVPAEVK